MRSVKHPQNRLIVANAPDGAGLMVALAGRGDTVAVPERDRDALLLVRGMIERLGLESPSPKAIITLPTQTKPPTGRQLPYTQLVIPGIHNPSVTNYSWSLGGRLLIADKTSNHLGLLTIQDTARREVVTRQEARSIARALLSLVPDSRGLAVAFADKEVITTNFPQFSKVVDPIIASGGVPTIGVVSDGRSKGKLSDAQVFITAEIATDFVLSVVKRTEGGIGSDTGFQGFVASDSLKTGCNWLRERGFRGYATITLATADDSSQVVQAVRPYWTASMAATLMAAKVAARDQKDIQWSVVHQPVKGKYATADGSASLLGEKNCLLSPGARKGVVPLSFPIPSRKTLCYVAFGDTGEEVQAVVSAVRQWVS